MSSAVTGFISTWSPSYESTRHRIECRNVRQGGNDLLAAVPQGLQAMWAGDVLGRVSEVTQGPIKWVAKGFSYLFNPLISLPVSIVSCAVKEKFYEGSVSSPLPAQTRYFERGAEVPQPIAGTVSLMVGGQLRHFISGGDVNWMMENSTVVQKDGQMKRYYYRRLEANEAFDAECREIEIDGQRVRVRLRWEISEEDQNNFELTAGGGKNFYRLGNEVAEPIQGTVTVRNPGAGLWNRTHYMIGNEIPHETPNCIKIRAEERVLHYETGRELSGPEAGSRSFVINGVTRHFASAKYVPASSLGLSGWFNKIPKLPFKIPTRLSRFTIQALEFINKHMSNIVRVAIIVSGVTLAFFGHFYMALGAVCAVAYEYLDHDLGVIPQKVSAFMEKWMPTISMVGILIVGSFFSQVMAGATLLLMIPAVNLWVHQKISKAVRSVLVPLKDTIINKLAARRGAPPQQLIEMSKAIDAHPTLEEFDAPLVENKRLNKAQINAILAANNNAYEFNPAHFTKIDPPSFQLRENRNFGELIRLWDTIGPRWVENNTFNRLMKRLADDERFILFMQKRFPEAKLFHYEENWRLGNEENRRVRNELQVAHRNQLEEWVRILAQEKGGTKQQYVADWVKQQLQFFVGKLSGARPIEGEQRYLVSAIQNVSKTIPFLLKPDVLPVELEDTLTKLAIEGGDYCAIAMNRCSTEVLEGFTEPLQNQPQEGVAVDPQKAFEKEVRLTLQKARLRLVQNLYQETIIQLLRNKEQTRKTGEDIHLYAAITRAMKRGFYPLEKDDLDEFSLTELMLMETVLLPVQIALFKGYEAQLPREISDLGINRRNLMHNRVLEYLRTWVNENNSLNAIEKAELLNGALLNDPDHLADHDNYPKWGRLMLTILGIVREKKIPPAPVVQPVAARPLVPVGA